MPSDAELLAEWQSANAAPKSIRPDSEIVNEWQTANQPSSFGYIDSIMSGLPFMDEFRAGAKTIGKKTLGELLSPFTGNDPGSWGEVYDAELAKTRGEEKQFINEHPIAGRALPIVGSSVIPTGKIDSLKKAAGLGALLGGSYGFAGGENGLENRATEAIKGAAFGAPLGATAYGLVKGAGWLANAIAGTPSEETALLQAFKVPENKVDEALPILKTLKDQGVITAPKSNTPFGDIKTNLSNAIRASEDDVQAELAKMPALTTEDILPSADNLLSATSSGAEQKAVTSAVQAEQAAIIKNALQKMYPDEEFAAIEQFYDEYLQLGKMAASGDTAAAKVYDQITAQIKNTKWTPNEIRELRIKYDKQAKWERRTQGDKADAYKGLRDALQDKIINMGGGEESAIAKTFSEYAPQMGGQRLVKRMAGAEKKGTTQAPGALSQLINYGIRRPLSYVFSGIQPAKKAETALKQAFGMTLPQKLEGALQGRLGAPLSAIIRGETELTRGPQPDRSSSKLSALINQEQNMDAPKVISGERLPAEIEKLAKAVSSVESGGLKDRDAALSPKGAAGYMQIMPATAKEVLTELGEDPDSWNPKDRAMNIRVGTAYLQKMLKQFGDIKLALAAYNMGPGALEKAIAKFKSRDWDVIAQRLRDKGAYLETVAYVPKVMKQLDVVEV